MFDCGRGEHGEGFRLAHKTQTSSEAGASQATSSHLVQVKIEINLIDSLFQKWSELMKARRWVENMEKWILNYANADFIAWIFYSQLPMLARTELFKYSISICSKDWGVHQFGL